MTPTEHQQRRECADKMKEHSNTLKELWTAVSSKVPWYIFAAVLGPVLAFVTWMTLAHFAQQQLVTHNAAIVTGIIETQSVQRETAREHTGRLVITEQKIAVQEEKWREITETLGDIKDALGIKPSKTPRVQVSTSLPNLVTVVPPPTNGG